MSEPQPERRQSGLRYSPRRVSTLVFLLALVLIGLSTAALILVGRVAFWEANAQALRNDIRLFTNAVRDQKALMAREQLSLARWTRAYQHIHEKFDQDFIRTDIVDVLWHDFGHFQSFLVAGGERVVMAAQEDQASFTAYALDRDDPVALISRRAVERYMQGREPMGGGFRPKLVSAFRANEAAVTAFSVLDGTPVMLSAMAVVPDEDSNIVMPDGAPLIMVSAKRLRHEGIKGLNAQLAFKDFALIENARPADSLWPHVLGLNDEILGYFTWSPDLPGSRIWSIVVPLILLLTTALILAGGLIARRIHGISAALEMSEARNRRLALEDALTGLANRLSFGEALDKACSTLPDAAFAIIACDLDRFKAVNDTYGHAAGDVVIRAVADRLRETVGSAGLIGRVGGDEFLILITAFADRPRLAVLSAQIIDAVRAPIAVGEGEWTDVGISLGIAIAPAHGQNAKALLANADAALYRAKDRGRGVAALADDVTAPSVAAPKDSHVDAA